MLERVIEQRRRDLGGFEVGRVLPSAARRMVGPFIFLDHMGPVNFHDGAGMDVRPHPHIGLATVTYLFEGEIFHRDSVGSAQAIRPGEVNWMTAGRGITHSERTDPKIRAKGGPMHGMQSWVALPDEDEETEPNFVHHPYTDLPVFEDKGVFARLIAGTAYGLKSAVRIYSPLFYLHADLSAGASLALPSEHEERAAYIVAGKIGHDGHGYSEGHLLVFAKGGAPKITAEVPSKVMLLGGAPIGVRFIWWNLVSSSRDRIRAAKEDWVNGRMKLPPGDDREFTPAPDSPPLP